MVLHLFPMISFSSMIRRHKMTSLITSLTRRFIWNAKSFCPTSQTLLYLVHLALGDGLLFVRNSRGVPTCSYRSSTSTCMPLIPLYLGLLQYFEVHILQLHQISFPRYYVSLGRIIQITLIIIVSLPSLKMNWPHSSMRRPCCGEVP